MEALDGVLCRIALRSPAQAHHRHRIGDQFGQLLVDPAALIRIEFAAPSGEYCVDPRIVEAKEWW